MCFSAIAVANTILDMAAKKEINDITPMKLQKLVFLAHALYYKQSGNKLITDPVEKWKYGPVIYDVYREFRGFGSAPITSYAQNADGSTDIVPLSREDVYDFLSKILTVFGYTSAWRLSELTHLTGTAWDIASGAYITDENILEGDIFSD